MDYQEERRQCQFCGEELAHSAYYRHLHDKVGSVCPGKSTLQQPVVAMESCEMDNTDLDSTFDLGSESDDDYMADEHIYTPPSETDSDVNFSDCNNQTSSEGEEVWDVSEDEAIETSKEEDRTSNILHGVILFLNYFHLFYNLPERAMRTLLQFLGILLSFLAKLCNNNVLTQLSNTFPKSLYCIRKRLKNGDECTEYIVCPKCSTLYTLGECITENGSQQPKMCNHVEFPNHPQHSRRAKCNSSLVKSVQIGRKTKLVPRKVFAYHSVIETLKEMARRPGFLDMCEHWRDREVTDVLGDIYDGKVWKSMQSVAGRPFLTVPYNLCLGLNIDWFNPFSETQYSAGAIYLTIFNLPRDVRYRLENMILVGMMPGPNEPKNVNPFLHPFVEEMNKLYSGVTINNASSFLSTCTIRAMLVCVMCDLPACRKVCGFSNFNALKGCSKCLKEFPTSHFGEKPNYSGYNCDSWTKRDLSVHRIKAKEHKEATTLKKRTEIQQAYGLKYSELLNLPSFDIVRCHVVDPMHNIFLGIAKHAFKTWKDSALLSSSHFEIIQAKIDLMNPPPKLGRIVRKINSGFASLTANEWKNWILMYSLHGLWKVLPDEDYHCWSIFVEACHILLLPVITESQIQKSHDLLVVYFENFWMLYGSEYCNPNMHMACHIKECMLDYGPLSSFWCFAFERYNGVLEGIQKSWYRPEKQMLTKFLDVQRVCTLQASVSSTDQEKNFTTLLCGDANVFCHGIQETYDAPTPQDIVVTQQIKNYSCSVSILDAREKDYQHLALPLREKCFTDAELTYLEQMYSFLYLSSRIEHIHRFYHQSKSVSINNEDYVSTISRSTRSSVVAAHWLGVNNIDPLGESPLRIGVITRFFRHSIDIIRRPTSSTAKKETISHIIAQVSWYMDHPRRDYLHPSIIISSAVFENDSSAIFIPVSRVAARCAVAKTTFTFDYGEDSIVISVPLLKFIP